MQPMQRQLSSVVKYLWQLSLYRREVKSSVSGFQVVSSNYGFHLEFFSRRRAHDGQISVFRVPVALESSLNPEVHRRNPALLVAGSS